jgi:hypothetical protein
VKKHGRKTKPAGRHKTPRPQPPSPPPHPKETVEITPLPTSMPGKPPSPLPRKFLFGLWCFFRDRIEGPLLLLSIAANVVQIWGPFWPTSPDFSPVSLSFGSSFDVPFVVTNRSVIYGLNNLKLACDLISVRTDRNINITNINVAIAESSNYLPPQGTSSYTCPFNKTITVIGNLTEAAIKFTSEYDSRLWWGKTKTSSEVFTLNTHTVPAQWMRGVPLR